MASPVASLIAENGKFYFVKYGHEVVKVEVSVMDLEDLVDDATELLTEHYNSEIL